MSFTKIGSGNTAKSAANRETTLCRVKFIFTLKTFILHTSHCKGQFSRVHTSPAQLCPISAGWSSLHPLTFSSFGNQLLEADY